MEHDVYWSRAEQNQQWTLISPLIHSPPDIFKQKENNAAELGMHALNSKNPKFLGILLQLMANYQGRYISNITQEKMEIN